MIIARENTTFVSVVSLWEAAIKVRSGKLVINAPSVADSVELSGLHTLGLATEHLTALDRLTWHPDHRDPFDHLLIAQAIAEGMTFVSDDLHTERYPVERLACRA